MEKQMNSNTQTFFFIFNIYRKKSLPSFKPYYLATAVQTGAGRGLHT